MAEITLDIIGDKKEVLHDVLPDLFESEGLTLGMSKDIPGGGVIRLERMPLAKTEPSGLYAATIILSVGEGAVGSLIAAYIYDKLTKKYRRKKIMVRHREEYYDRSGLTKVIEDTIEIEEVDE
jgi:hypothetical protein